MNRNRRVALGLLMATAACLASPVLAKCELDLTSRDTMRRSGDCFGFYVEAPKKRRIAKTVAILAFQVRYALRAGTAEPAALDFDGRRVPIDASRKNFYELSLEEYDRITSALYDEFVGRMAAAGVEVLDPQRVKSSAGYQKLKKDTAPLQKEGRFARGTAHGLQNLNPRPNDVTIQRLANITHELGVDAVLTVFATAGLIGVGGSDGAATVAIGTTAEQEGNLPLEIQVMGGTLEQKVPGAGVTYIPEWRSRFGVQRTASERLVYRESLGPLLPSAGTLQGPDYGDDVDAYVTGARTLLRAASEVAIRLWLPESQGGGS